MTAPDVSLTTPAMPDGTCASTRAVGTISSTHATRMRIGRTPCALHRFVMSFASLLGVSFVVLRGVRVYSHDPTPPYFPSTENASRTLPGIPFEAYPDPTKSIPPAIAGPGPFSDPPRAGTSLVVL